MSMRASILDTIIAVKRVEVAALTEHWPDLSELTQAARTAHTPLGFARRVRSTPAPAIVAEVKRASPSKGVIRGDLDPVATADAFASNGAACISVLTDAQFFQGSNAFLQQIRLSHPHIPLLRKDFTVSPYQIWEARLIGADAVLLIVGALDDNDLLLLAETALAADLDLLVEVHSADELDRAQALFITLQAKEPRLAERMLLGINNRDLHSFTVDLKVTAALIDRLRQGPALDATVITESGMKNARDLIELAAYGAQGFLIGESLVAEGGPGENLSALIGEFHSLKGK